VLGYESTIAALTRAALASAVVTRAAACARWREMYVAVPFEGITLEGYVDLVFRDDDGLVVVDYKTDVDVTSKRADYERQIQLYAAALTAASPKNAVNAKARGVIFLV
jgi:ATP-dependent helicase/nuclease subunit A